MNKAKYQTILIVVVMLILGALTVVTFADSYSLDIDKYEVTTYCVKQGDTLWGIAERYCSNSDDIRVWINEVEDLNDCTANIYPGQILEIYEYIGK